MKMEQQKYTLAELIAAASKKMEMSPAEELIYNREQALSRERDIEHNIAAIGIPLEFRDAEREDFPGYPIDSYMKHKFLNFRGASGLGKTRLMMLLVKEFIRQDKYVRLINEETDLKGMTYAKLVKFCERLYNVPRLIWDDLGFIKMYDEHRDVIKALFASRMKRGLDTYITTNSIMENLFDKRMASRMTMAFAVYEFKGEDLRLEHININEINIDDPSGH